MEQCPTLKAANDRLQELVDENKKLKETIKNTIWYVKANAHTNNIRELVLYMLETAEAKKADETKDN